MTGESKTFSYVGESVCKKGSMALTCPLQPYQ